MPALSQVIIKDSKEPHKRSPHPQTNNHQCHFLNLPLYENHVQILKPLQVQAEGGARARGFACKCELNEQSLSSESTRKDALKLGIGTPVIIVEAPKMIKTAASVPCLRVNAGLVNPGDVRR